MTLILRKLLASSTYAISNTLLGLANKLEAAEQAQQILRCAAGLFGRKLRIIAGD